MLHSSVREKAVRARIALYVVTVPHSETTSVGTVPQQFRRKCEKDPASKQLILGLYKRFVKVDCVCDASKPYFSHRSLFLTCTFAYTLSLSWVFQLVVCIWYIFQLYDYVKHVFNDRRLKPYEVIYGHYYKLHCLCCLETKYILSVLR